jgi:hypothetical protein
VERAVGVSRSLYEPGAPAWGLHRTSGADAAEATATAEEPEALGV